MVQARGESGSYLHVMGQILNKTTKKQKILAIFSTTH